MPKSTKNSFQFLSGSALKLIAVLTMLTDHIALFLMSGEAPVLADPLIRLFGSCFHLSEAMRFVGRTTFPLYCFLLTEGFVHTHDRKKYAVRLLLFALVSDIPWDLLFHGRLFDPSSQNVFFTLLLGFLGMWAMLNSGDALWKKAAVLGVFTLGALVLNCDYGVRGVWLIWLMYLLRDRRLYQAVLGVCLHPNTWKTIPAFALTCLYNGERGFVRTRAMQFAFYAFYPVHLTILYLILISRQTISL